MEKNRPNLQELLQRYESGGSSLHDDAELSGYAGDDSSEDVPESIRAQFVYFRDKKSELPSPALETKLNDLLETPALKQRRFPILYRIAATLIVGLCIGWVVFTYTIPRKETLSTGPGEHTHTTLPDGTTVSLNGGSELVYDREFDGERREVHLKGEAYFDVKRDTQRPFIIHTGNAQTEVLGTSFNLRHYEPEHTTELTVKSGQVRFGASEKVMVVKGQSAILAGDSMKVNITQANANADAWKTGRLTFQNAKMADVVRDLARHFQVRVTVEDNALLDCHFTGTFNHADIESVLNVIAYSLSFRYSLADGTYIISGQPCQP